MGTAFRVPKLRVLPLKKVFFHLFSGHTFRNAKGELMKDSTVLLQEMMSDPHPLTSLLSASDGTTVQLNAEKTKT